MKSQKSDNRFLVMVILITAVLLCGLSTQALAAKGGNGNGNGGTGDVGGDTSGWVYSEVMIDDITSGVASDGDGPYFDGADRTEMRIGRNFNIQLNFDTHKKKEAIRTLFLPNPFPIPVVPDEECWPTYEGFHFPAASETGPTFEAGVAEKATLKIRGQDHDDTPVNCVRSEVAELEVTDKNGQTWRVVYGPGFDEMGCRDSMKVTRLDNFEGGDPGISTWEFTTTGVGRGYLYRDNNPPHTPTEFWGVVTLPMGGTITSLTEEDHPGYCP